MSPKRHRLAAIDVGTNSIHMIIVEAQRRGFRVIDKEKEMVQLGRGSLEGKPLTADAMQRGIAALQKMAEIAKRDDVDDVVAVATSAVREAPNGHEFVRAAQKATGIKLRTISGEEEADYIYRAVRSSVDFHGGTALIVDIGGGSLEMILGTDAEVYLARSEPLGVLRTSQMFFADDPPNARQIEQCRDFTRRRLKKTLSRVRKVGFDLCVGTSGTINALAELAADARIEKEPTGNIALRSLSRAKLGEIIDALASVSAAERASRFGIDGKRADTILAGAVVLHEVMREVDADQIVACSAALREGIVDRVLSERNLTESGGVSIRRSAVLDLLDRSGADRTHAMHVAKLATRIFDQTTKLHKLRPLDRELLEDAALLHEIGMQVSFQSYHKHTYYLVRHAGLRGFTEDQLAIVANVAKFHRKKLPDDEAFSLTELAVEQRGVVMKLASILRIADALDRSRRQAIRDLGVEYGAEAVTFTLRQRHHVPVDLETAAKQAKLFSRTFGRKVEFELAE